MTYPSPRRMESTMAPGNDAIDIRELRDRLQRIDGESPTSTLCFSPPSPGTAAFFRGLCDAYRAASGRDRSLVREEVARWRGVVDALLAFLYDCIAAFRNERDASLLMTALAAASIRGDGPDYRDFYMALAELFSAFREAGLDPAAEFNAMGGGIPSDFHTFAVARGR